MPVLRPPRALATTLSLAGVAQVVAALAIAAIVQLHLRLVDVSVIGRVAVVTPGQCLLGPAGVVGSTCYYAYTVAAASVFASFLVSLLRCARVSWGLWLETSFAAAMVGWWAVAAVVFAVKGGAAAAAGLPAAGWRVTVIILAWVEVALFATLAVAYTRLARWARQQLAALAAGGPPGGGVELGAVGYGGVPFGAPAWPAAPPQAVQYAFGPVATPMAPAPAPAPVPAPAPPPPAPPPPTAGASGNPFAPAPPK